MPRKKIAPKRLDDEEQKAKEFVLGEAENKEEAVENIQINKALTESLTNASAAEVQDILASVQHKEQPEPGAGPSQAEAPSSSIQLRASTTER